mmetsp:Transcript_21666/g.66793  ORF Transcript_21666/g.66793 Transcript_21666/m.66793 type:complete len:198 (+) Transcript_21666:79-672(+)|eukprot:CAMPEP_0198655110 /NCGR_PEP_ID=MMETSP1467-20131203/8149_1 /TAXON_ID=1462469 /ORGANISM="unid. sp., Strain CCMP2135" /LENGTH=197 /DNA_ID=CAMNT_0044391109 /DNA_START=54 /DNA_END=647 /DNA_ORIENTATION=+
MKKVTARQRRLLENYLEELIAAGKAFRESCTAPDVKDEDDVAEDAVQEFSQLATQRRASCRADASERPQEKTRGKKLGPWYDVWVAEDPSHTLEKWRSMKVGERSKERNRIHSLHPHLAKQRDEPPTHAVLTDAPASESKDQEASASSSCLSPGLIATGKNDAHHNGRGSDDSSSDEDDGEVVPTLGPPGLLLETTE